jgi:hypothetical protein
MKDADPMRIRDTKYCTSANLLLLEALNMLVICCTEAFVTKTKMKSWCKNRDYNRYGTGTVPYSEEGFQ